MEVLKRCGKLEELYGQTYGKELEKDDLLDKSLASEDEEFKQF